VAEDTVAGRVDVALVADDAALVSWLEKPGAGSEGSIRVRRVPVRGSPEPAQVVAAGDVSRSGGFPQMIAGRAGLVWAWTQPGQPSRVRTAVSARE
jgi:hypothetical protein